MPKPTILLDEQILGMDVYLRDLNWQVSKVSDVLKPGASDDEVVKVARNGNYVVVTLDRKLIRRCKVLGIRVVELGLEDFAKKVHTTLEKELDSR